MTCYCGQPAKADYLVHVVYEYGYWNSLAGETDDVHTYLCAEHMPPLWPGKHVASEGTLRAYEESAAKRLLGIRWDDEIEVVEVDVTDLTEYRTKMAV